MSSVISGQQVGILGGPFYVLVKIIGVIKVAERTGLKPIFWLETNDADFNEIKNSFYLDEQDNLKKISWRINSQGKSIGYLKVDQFLLDELDKFFKDIKTTKNTESLKKYVDKSYALGRTLAEANLDFFKFILKERFKKELLFDPQVAAFRKFSRPFLLREANKTLLDEQVNAFLIREEKRLAFFKTKQGFRLRNGEKVDLSNYELVPNVFTRSIIQDAYFDGAYYLAGKGELAYLNSEPIKKSYDFHQVKRAEPQLRYQVEIGHMEDKDFLSENTLQLEDIFFKPYYQIRKDYFIKHYSFDFLKIKKRLKSWKDAHFKPLMNEAKRNAKKKLISELRAEERSTYQKHKHLLGARRKKLKQENEGVLNLLKKYSTLYFPDEAPSSRNFSVAYYYNLFGSELIDRIYSSYENEKKEILWL